MKRFYVSFGLGTILRGYYATFEALDQDIVAAYCNKHLRGLWSNIYTDPPRNSQMLQKQPEQLFYQKAAHV